MEVIETKKERKKRVASGEETERRGERVQQKVPFEGS